MKNILPFSNSQGSNRLPLFESCKSFDLDNLTVEQLRAIDEMVLTEGKGYLDLVAEKYGWDMENLNEDFEISEDMTLSEFLKEHFEDFNERDFLNYLAEDLGIDSVENLSEEEINGYLEMNEGLFKKIGQAFKKVAQKVAPVVKKIAKVVKKALPIITMVASIALTACGVPVGLAYAAKAIGFVSKGAKALKAVSGVQKLVKGAKALKNVAKVTSKLKKVKSAFNNLKAVKKINTLANKSKAFKQALNLAKDGAKKVKDDLLKRGAEALESPDNQQIAGTLAATYQSSTEAADELEKGGGETGEAIGGEEAQG